MNLNEKMLRDIWHHAYSYDCQLEEIEEFLLNANPFFPRQKMAIKVIDGIMTMHGKRNLLEHVSELAKVEQGIKELQPWVRDHVVHALLCYLFGILLKENLASLKKISKFEWQLSGLLHDIGYPIQVAKDIKDPFTSKVNEIKRKIGVRTPDVNIKLTPIGFNKLQNSEDSFKLIQECLNEWNLDINAQFEFEEMVNNNTICHGIISSLTILYIIDLLYQKYNPKREHKSIESDNGSIDWNQDNFEHKVVPACSAIYIHNLPSNRFRNAKINPEIAPLAFLLKLTDCLQEWERPSSKNENGISSSEFDYEFDSQNKLHFHVKNDRIRDKIQNDIHNSLICNDIVLKDL